MISEETKNKYEMVIGLEVNAQLKTKTKIFAPDGTKFGQTPNSQTSTITLGLPGVLPVLNREVVNMAIFYAGLLSGQKSPALQV
jgi:aspartyl-tRNA(Asn)/glutamyl-tRNA(Gln) amidotransferase subunit B